MPRTYQSGVLLITALLIIALAVLLRVGSAQRKTIAELQSRITILESSALPPPSSEPESVEPLHAPVAVDTNSTDQRPIVAVEQNNENTFTSTAVAALRQEKEALAARLEELAAELHQVQQVVPEPQDPKSAYVGPGTWINSNPNTGGITKVVITGMPGSPTLTIQAWGQCHPEDCEWGEVQLFLLKSRPLKRDPSGLAIWDFAEFTKFVVVTFQKADLKLDTISVSKGSSPHWRSAEAESMIRIY